MILIANFTIKYMSAKAIIIAIFIRLVGYFIKLVLIKMTSLLKKRHDVRKKLSFLDYKVTKLTNYVCIG